MNYTNYDSSMCDFLSPLCTSINVFNKWQIKVELPWKRHVNWFTEMILTVMISVKVKVTVKFTTEQAMKVRGGGKCNSLSLTYAVHGGGRSTHSPIRYIPEKNSVPGWAPGPVWKDAENIAPTGIRSPNRRARSVWLYPLLHPGPHLCYSYQSVISQETLLQ